MCEYVLPSASRLLGAPGDGERTIRQVDSDGGVVRRDRIPDFDCPGFPAGRCAEGVDGAPSGADQRGRDLSAPEQAHDAIDGIALGNSAEVELDPWRVEGDRPRTAIDDDMRASDEPPGGRQFGLGGHSPLAPGRIPTPSSADRR